MSLFHVTPDKLHPVADTTFAAERLLERKDLQRLLRKDITPIGDDLLVIAEEYGNWEDSIRRIDLLCLTRAAGLAVVEIKRTNDGGHMELQAIRYAAMVSSTTLDHAVAAYALTMGVEVSVARSVILEFLNAESAEDVELSGEVRIILISANFSTELTTAVLWLNKHDLDITCIRIRPYRMGPDVLIDVTQIVPLPEAADYEVKLREQEKEQRKAQTARRDILRRFWTGFLMRSKTRTQVYANRQPCDQGWIGGPIGRGGFRLNTTLSEESGRVECYIRQAGGREANVAAFEALKSQRESIESIFGGALDWQALEGREVCRVCTHFDAGWGAPESEWPAIQDRMIDAVVRLERALKMPIHGLDL